MLWTQRVQSFEDHQIERPLQNFRLVGAHHRSFGYRKEDSMRSFAMSIGEFGRAIASGLTT
jgi:hypothetical protein